MQTFEIVKRHAFNIQLLRGFGKWMVVQRTISYNVKETFSSRDAAEYFIEYLSGESVRNHEKFDDDLRTYERRFYS